ncbi:MAG: ADP-ribosylglycohydrolase family protein [Hamadaea sp.]|uniref:ADP-ribosylglycohydrolase family protein n=1 Tax=Hamadaea sp. TaxID=2024425 RepID=UPI00178DEA55|nr:ADP-ribosylglycohydrolase family protein [Hamadaea sp.]NUR70226.1 ADP-ribosylglycohydrolase family protein [Hamadaea sp.]NUT22790.1 ADP-ribosylglycohydrolase family protein [Hamadaea sp.]
MLLAKSIGCLAGAAVGDALGGAVEGHSAEEIRAFYSGPVTGIAGPMRAAADKPTAPYSKGHGRITDDTLVTHALVRAYVRKRDHLDAYDMAGLLVPDLLEHLVWVPDLERETVALHRLAAGERHLITQLHFAHADPREAGVGNAVNCGAAMYMAPVGIVNAGDPVAAYREAIELAGAHQHSYGREAAGVMAACVAAAATPSATVDDVVAAALAVAQDGTRAAISAVVTAAHGYAVGSGLDLATVKGLRAAMAPFDTVGEAYRDPGLGARRPSRLHSIEELPIALGMLVVSGGDVRDTILGSVNYGRDADSIASMAGAIAGALCGVGFVPSSWVGSVSAASRLDLTAVGTSLALVASEVLARDLARADARARVARSLLDAGADAPRVAGAPAFGDAPGR